MKLSDREWEAFFIGDLFSVSRPIGRNKGHYIEGSIPFVASGSVNNGVMKCCKPNENEKLDKAGCITVSPVYGSAFYQSFDFLGRGGAGSSILLLRSNSLNYYNGLFIAKMITQTCSCKYTYGHMGNKDNIKRERIMLPISVTGEPDFRFMADYTKELIEKKKAQYKIYLNNLEKIFNMPAFKSKIWDSFSIPEIFDCIQRGKRLKNADHIKGIVPYVSSTALNNGVDDFIDDTKGTRVFSNCISLANSGSVGTAFFEPFRFVASDHITHLKSNNANMYIYLFLISVLEKQRTNFNFNREINDQRIRRMKIMLPINENGDPDYAFMEQYGKMLVSRKYQQYLTYLDSQKSK